NVRQVLELLAAGPLPAFRAPGTERGACRQVAVARRLRRARGHRHGGELPPRLLRLAAPERDLHTEQAPLALLLGTQAPFEARQYPRRLVGATRFDPVARRAQQVVIAAGATVLRGELLIDPG